MQLSPKLRKALSLLIVFTLAFQQAGFAQGLAQLDISRYLGNFSSNPLFRPVLLRYFSYNPLDDSFQLLLDKGTLKGIKTEEVKEQGKELLKYFLTGVALPDENFWVNLRPDSEDEIITEDLGKTDLGRVLLDADLKLKKDVATFTSPETAEGREYWDKLYKKAGELFSTSEITIPTLTRPWIVPGEVIIRESGNSAYVYKATLKVMLEQDYLKNPSTVIASEAKQSLYNTYSFKDPRLKELNEYSSQLIRELIIPKLTKEVNSSERYAQLRQVFFSLILSRWFKNKFSGTSGQYANLINSGNLNGLTSQQDWSKTTYFEEYKKSFAQGEYNLKEQVNSITGPVIRSYFSGGIDGRKLTPIGGFSGNAAVTRVITNGLVPLTDKSSYPASPAPSGSSPVVAKEPPINYFGFQDKSLSQRTGNKTLFGGKGNNLAEMARFAEEFNERYKTQGFKLNVPPGFTVTAEQTALWWERMKAITDEQRAKMTLIEYIRATLGEELIAELNKSIRLLEKTMGKKFGDEKDNPLLVSVRSGSKESMPGMMDTILNLGLNLKNVLALARATNAEFARDAYRRFIEMFSKTVLGIQENEKERKGLKYILQKMIKEKGYRDEYDLKAVNLQELVGLYEKELASQNLTIPEDPMEQYLMADYAVMRSSFNKRAEEYRRKAGFKLVDTFSAVNVLPMIFGNMDELSGSGVSFSRNPSTGENVPYLEYNVKCQGEDVVSGRKKGLMLEELRERFPQVAANLEAILAFLEEKYKDVQDVEFTFEHNPKTNEIKLWILQTRNAKRTAMAEVRTAVEMVNEGLISIKQAVKRITPAKMVELFVNQFDRNDKKKALDEGRLLSDSGLNASPGAGVGVLVLDSERAKDLKKMIDSVKERLKNGEIVSDEERYSSRGVDLNTVDGGVLARDETAPDDLDGMLASVGFWTKKGGRTSHAAVVARQFGKAAVTGDDNIEIDFEKRTVTVTKKDGTQVVLHEGDLVSLDGTGEGAKGQVFAGRIEVLPSSIAVALYKENLNKVRRIVDLLKKWSQSASGDTLGEYNKHIAAYEAHIAKYSELELNKEDQALYRQYKTFMQWVEEIEGMAVAANAEKPLEIEYANLVGAKNFGLIRTEHQFSGDGRELKFQKFILAKTEEARREALKEILPIQQVDFEQQFLFAEGKPVTIRLIDPPLHEFVPKSDEKIIELALALMLDKEELQAALKTANEQLKNLRENKVVLSEEEKIRLFAEAAKMYEDRQIRILGYKVRDIKQGIEELREENPMFGTRGCRLSTIYPEITEMQATAILSALKKSEQAGIKVKVEIMIPLVGNAREFIFQKDIIEKVSKELGVARDSFLIGTMIEITAGAVNIRELIEAGIEFISFGTNDLTQGVLKISRDDGKDWLRIAQQVGIFDEDPFVTISPEVASFIGRVMKIGRAINPKFKAGICGEQGLDATSIIKYLAPFGLNYVSGSPRGIPGARVAGAQAKIKMDEEVAAKLEELAKEPQPEALSGQGIEVTITTGKPVETAHSIGMIETGPAFFNPDIRYEVQKFLLSKGNMGELSLLPFIRLFTGYIAKIMKRGQPLSIRLPDLALSAIFKYESDEESKEAIKRLSADLKMTEAQVQARIAQFNEANPAIGTRGMRAYLLKEIEPLYTVMAKVAAVSAKTAGNGNVNIILPFLINGRELEVILDGYEADNGETIVSSLREDLQEFEGINIRFGAVIETPAAVVTAKDIAEHADFLVIDVKKLTEAVWAAFEKDTRAGFFDAYMKEGIWDKDIFVYAPKEVKELIQEAINAARQKKPDLEIRVVTNSKDSDLISLAKDSGVNSLIVPPEDVILASAKAASSPAKQSTQGVEGVFRDLLSRNSVNGNKWIYKEDGSYRFLEHSSGTVAMTLPRSNMFWTMHFNDIGRQQSINVIYNNTRKQLGVSIGSGNMVWRSIPSDPFVTLDWDTNGSVETITSVFSVDAIAVFRDLGLTDMDFDVLDADGNLRRRIVSVTQIAEVSRPGGKLDIATTSDTGAASSPVGTVTFDELESKLGEKINKIRNYAFQTRARNNSLNMPEKTFQVFLNGQEYEFSWIEGVNIPKNRILVAIKSFPSPKDYQYELSTGDELNDPTYSGNQLFIRMRASSPVATSSMNRFETTAAAGAGAAASSAVKSSVKPGGIDFRVINIITRPMGNMSGLNFSLSKLSNVENINLDDELSQIQNMLQAGIIPSGDRLKEFVAACYQKGELKTYLEGIVTSVVDTCKLQEERVEVISNSLKEVMLLVEAVI